MELRVQRQSGNAGKLVSWIDDALTSSNPSPEAKTVRSAVSSITHASLQADDMSWLKAQMPNGFGPVFAVYTHTVDQARRLPSYLKLFQHATSLGGVESLIEWRRMSDVDVDGRLLRVSVGVEGWEDLRDDLLEAFKVVGGSAAESKDASDGSTVQVGEEGAQMPEAGSGAV
jgi:cystathionine gamma-synthase